MKIFNFAKLGQTLLMAAVLVVGAVCVSYGDNPSNLVGQWVNMNDGQKVELFEDGTGVIGNENITWKTMGKRFVLSSGNTSKVGDYNLSGYELTRTFDGGEVIVWVRKDKVVEYNKKNSIDFIDLRDGKKYRTVKIGGKTWMAQNLNYQIDISGCYGENNSNCEKYGRLYTWSTAMKACPVGWHLPSLSEWSDLAAVAGGDVAGKVLKSTVGWDSNGNGTDDFGFSALPGGNFDIDFNQKGHFKWVGNSGYWWTASMLRSSFIHARNMQYDKDGVRESGFGGGAALSVRCVKDE